MSNEPLTDEELAAIEQRVNSANQQDTHMCSSCTEYQCDCHKDVPRLVAEVRRLKAERLTLARAYNPNCDEYDFGEQMDAMAAAASIVDSVRELARFFGQDPEMSCHLVCDRAAGEIEKLKSQLATITASHRTPAGDST